jgi:hypothetical protein
MGADLLLGPFFVFLNRWRNLLKCLYWDRDGFALYVELDMKGIIPNSGLCRVGLPCSVYKRTF